METESGEFWGGVCLLNIWDTLEMKQKIWQNARYLCSNIQIMKNSLDCY